MECNLVWNHCVISTEFDLKSQVWFQTKIVRHELQLPLYYIHFEITHFFKICIYWSTRLVRKKRNRKRVYMYVSTKPNDRCYLMWLIGASGACWCRTGCWNVDRMDAFAAVLFWFETSFELFSFGTSLNSLIMWDSSFRLFLSISSLSSNEDSRSWPVISQITFHCWPDFSFDIMVGWLVSFFFVFRQEAMDFTMLPMVFSPILILVWEISFDWGRFITLRYSGPSFIPSGRLDNQSLKRLTGSVFPLFFAILSDHRFVI